MPAKKPERTRPAKTAILIVDDHPMLRRGLASLIESEPDLAVCGEASTCQAALQAIRQSKPDLVIVDLGLERCDGLDLIKEMKLHHAGTPALVLSMHDESLYAERVLRAGARGYVTKQQLDETVLIAIRRVLNGELYMSEKIGARFAEKFLGG
jgi:DNA-binding NarL/FixJ family response regulator